MNQIVLERRKQPPIGLDDLRTTMLSPGWWCLKLHRVHHVASLLSSDGCAVTCFFDARDAESLRTMMRRVGEPYERVWSATVHAPAHLPAASSLGGRHASLVLVTRAFDAPAELAALQATEDRSAWCLEQHRVRYLRTWFASDRRRMLCLYAAPDAEAVRLVQRQAGMPFEEAWGVQLYESRSAAS